MTTPNQATAPMTEEQRTAGLTDETMARIREENPGINLFIMEAVAGREGDEPPQYIVFKKPNSGEVRRVQEKLSVDKLSPSMEFMAHKMFLQCGCLVWPPKPEQEVLFEEYPLVAKRIFNEVTRICAGLGALEAKKA